MKLRQLRMPSRQGLKTRKLAPHAKANSDKSSKSRSFTASWGCRRQAIVFIAVTKRGSRSETPAKLGNAAAMPAMRR